MRSHVSLLACLLLLASCGSADGNYNGAADQELIEAQVNTGILTTRWDTTLAGSSYLGNRRQPHHALRAAEGLLSSF